ncbi:DUF1127 domain-containing protein [Pseudaminobacter arsenicus]|uniref:DUF1127 domain-containing protein n=1 Tax=Borborobacter arsenicus TaxID=1851146 RepID=A0A432UZD8_9HYPH|nr:DUF1127 domain-containing protein [Pseudaminobacter arsenicus]RUM95307.1 DUF1127 domain-containing protein [Pseudaminobacter arsenicus]
MSILTLEFRAVRRSSVLTGKILAAYRAFQANRARHIASRTLSAMEDHTLKDIGISRSEIPMVVYGLRAARGDHVDHEA